MEISPFSPHLSFSLHVPLSSHTVMSSPCRSSGLRPRRPPQSGYVTSHLFTIGSILSNFLLILRSVQSLNCYNFLRRISGGEVIFVGYDSRALGRFDPIFCQGDFDERSPNQAYFDVGSCFTLVLRGVQIRLAGTILVG